MALAVGMAFMAFILLMAFMDFMAIGILEASGSEALDHWASLGLEMAVQKQSNQITWNAWKKNSGQFFHSMSKILWLMEVRLP